jgi:TolB-like protein/Tfp pilus assembly protein PilF
MNFLAELKRRNVVRVGIAYVVGGWLLLQLTEVLSELLNLPEQVGPIVVSIVAICLPIALFFAWAYELTPEGVKREKDVDRNQSITSQTGRKLDRAIIGILVVVVAYLLVDKLILQDYPPAPAEPTQAATAEPEAVEETGPSVAVLPFVNMSGDKENEYFSDGLTETLLHMLAQLPDLRVAARTSSFAFKGQNKSIGEIANTLGVAHILEGSVQKSGDRVRVTAQLIRAEDGFHVWSQNYTRPLEDIFAIQDEIAEDVARALDSSLLGGATRTMRGVETTNLTAYESYLKGLEQQAIFSYGSLSIAENHFKQALARDPEFTDARLALVRNYLLKNSTGLLEKEQARELLEPLIQQVREQHSDNRLARALEIAATIQLSDAVLGQEELQPIVTELRNLLPLIPTETFARQKVAQILYFFFKDEQAALGILEAGLMIDPLVADLHRTLGNIYRDLERLDDALTSYKRARELAPDDPNTYSNLADLEEENNNLVAALEWRRQATEVDPQDHELAAGIANQLYKLDLPEEGDRWYARVVALAPNSPVAKHVQIHRLLARKEPQKTLELTRSMIADQVEDRRGAFREAMFTFMWLMMESGRSEEAYNFLISVRPGISNYDEMPRDIQGMLMQWVSIGLMTGFESNETRKGAWLKFVANLDNAGLPWRDPDDWGYVWEKFMAGDIDAATDTVLEHQLAGPLATDLEMHIPRNRFVFTGMYADPRVTARLAELGKEHQQFREQVRDLMLEPEWNQ